MGRLEALRQGGRTRQVEPPGEEEERAFETWVAEVARAAIAGGPPPAGAPQGFALEEIPGRGVWVLCEQDGRRRGAGAFALRAGPAAPVLIEAPHTFFDQGTLPLAAAIFEAQRARALLINTVHRYEGRPAPDDEGAEAGRRRPPPHSDVAHAERSFFLAAHRALIQAIPGALAVQLHGFQDTSAPGVAAILSAAGGRADVGALLASLRAALPGEAIRVYPTELQKLGGESNVQARASNAAGAPFYHLELSRSLRDRLVDDPALRRRFAAAFSIPGPSRHDTR
jgi:hypothetical protein